MEVAAADVRRSATYNGETSISLGIVKQATANPLEVAAAVRRTLDDLAPTLPEGMGSFVGYDTSVFIAESIRSVYETILEAIALVVLVIFVFLRTVRASFIPVVTIPIALITSFAIMLMFGFSINTLTLLAMVLAIGLVVDDAIVMLENIYRHIEMGKTPFQAAIDGSREITFAVIAMTLTLVAVYAPVSFAEGRTGKLFLEFALTLAGAVAVSGFVALTLTPMLCSKLLRHETSQGRIQRWLGDKLDELDAGYKKLLRHVLEMQRAVVAVAIVVGLSCAGFLMLLQQELAPLEDRGTLLVVGQAPQGATLEFSARYAKQIEQIYIDIPDVAGYLVVSGFPQITDLVSFSRLIHWGDRSRTQQEIVNEIQPKLARIPGILAFAVNPPSLGQSGRSLPVEYVVQASGTYEELEQYVSLMMQEIRQNPGFVNPDTNLKLQKPQLDIEVNRDKVVDAGIDVATVGRTLETLLGGRQVTRYEQGGKQYDVIVQVADEERQTPNDISNIYVRGGQGEMVQMSNLISVTETVAPNALNRFNQLRAATISANLAPGYSLGEAQAFLDEAALRLLPPTAQTDVDGQLREFVKSSNTILVTFVLALIFIYLVLAAQFESFLDPLVILVSVPLSIAGALLLLFLTGTTLNIFSQVGLITLVGLISKHGILIVEFSNQLRERGSSVYDAVVEASGLRLRPILMTTGAMVLGAMPLALSLAARARRAMAVDRSRHCRRHQLRHLADAVRRADGLSDPRRLAGAASCREGRTGCPRAGRIRPRNFYPCTDRVGKTGLKKPLLSSNCQKTVTNGFRADLSRNLSRIRTFDGAFPGAFVRTFKGAKKSAVDPFSQAHQGTSRGAEKKLIPARLRLRVKFSGRSTAARAGRG